MDGVAVGGSRLVSVGMALPDEVIGNDELVEMMDTSDDWIVTRTGIRERRRGGTATGLALEAARQALDRSAIDPELVDLVIVATHTPDDLCPSTAAGVQDGLGVTCGAYDLNAACAGFVYGVITAHAMIGAGVRAAVVVGVDRLTATTNYDDRSTAILFGDGAGAVVLVADGEGERGLRGWHMGTDGSRPGILKNGIEGRYLTGLEMDGPAVFKVMVRYAVAAARQALAEAGASIDDIAAVVAHQANQRILEAVADRIPIDRSRVVSVIAETGNTSAASIPLALDRAVGDGQIAGGDTILLLGFGGGLSWAAAVARWG